MSTSSDNKILLDEINVLKLICSQTKDAVSEMKSTIDFLLDDNKKLKTTLANIYVRTNNIFAQGEQINTSADVIKDSIHMTTSLQSTSSTSANPQITSYSNVVKNNHVVLIKPKLVQTSQTTKDDLRNKVDPSGFEFREVRNSAKGGVVIECSNLADSNKLMTDALSKLGPAYEVRVPAKRSTKIRIIGVSEELASDVLIKSLKDQNPEVLSSSSVLSVVHSFKLRNSYGYKIELDADCFNRIMVSQKLKIGWDICTVTEALDILRCYNCSAYHHTSKNCTSKACCPICSEEHKMADCKSSVFSCINCKEAAKTLRIAIDSAHPANSPECPVYVRKVKQQQRRTDYSSK